MEPGVNAGPRAKPGIPAGPRAEPGTGRVLPQLSKLAGPDREYGRTHYGKGVGGTPHYGRVSYGRGTGTRNVAAAGPLILAAPTTPWACRPGRRAGTPSASLARGSVGDRAERHIG